MEDRDWLILKVLYEKKNITKTGQNLFISQPTVTGRIQKIEEEFGVKIVYRGNKGVNFTPQGEYLAKFASDMIFRLRHVKENLTSMENKVVGTLRIGATRYFTKYKLPKILKLFKDLYPDVEYKVTTAWSNDLLNLASNQEVHIGFIRGDYSWAEQKYLLFEEPMVIASLAEIDLANLPNQPRIDYRTDYLTKGMIDNWWRDNYTSPPLISMEVDNVDTCKEMILSGMGYAIMPCMFINEITTMHKAILKNTNNKPLLRRTWMIWQNEQVEMNIVKCFVDFIKTLDFNQL